MQVAVFTIIQPAIAAPTTAAPVTGKIKFGLVCNVIQLSSFSLCGKGTVAVATKAPAKTPAAKGKTTLGAYYF